MRGRGTNLGTDPAQTLKPRRKVRVDGRGGGWQAGSIAAVEPRRTGPDAGRGPDRDAGRGARPVDGIGLSRIGPGSTAARRLRPGWSPAHYPPRPEPSPGGCARGPCRGGRPAVPGRACQGGRCAGGHPGPVPHRPVGSTGADADAPGTSARSRSDRARGRGARANPGAAQRIERKSRTQRPGARCPRPSSYPRRRADELGHERQAGAIAPRLEETARIRPRARRLPLHGRGSRPEMRRTSDRRRSRRGRRRPQAVQSQSVEPCLPCRENKSGKFDTKCPAGRATTSPSRETSRAVVR